MLYISFLQAFDRRAWTANEQIKIIQDFLDVSFLGASLYLI